MSTAISRGEMGAVRKGRPKGTTNKTTSIAKHVIAQAADRVGGIERLAAWIKEDKKNEQIFWSTIYTKLLPLQVNAEVEAMIGIGNIERTIICPGNGTGTGTGTAHHRKQAV